MRCCNKSARNRTLRGEQRVRTSDLNSPLLLCWCHNQQYQSLLTQQAYRLWRVLWSCQCAAPLPSSVFISSYLSILIPARVHPHSQNQQHYLVLTPVPVRVWRVQRNAMLNHVKHEMVECRFFFLSNVTPGWIAVCHTLSGYDQKGAEGALQQLTGTAGLCQLGVVSTSFQSAGALCGK